MLPFVKINFNNGAIGGNEPMEDGVTMMVLSGYKGADMDLMNIEDYRSKLGKGESERAEIVAFYNEVGGNSRLIVTGCAISDQALKDQIAKYNGEVRIIAVNGVKDVATLKVLQNVAMWATETLFAPCMFLVQATSDLIEGTANFRELELSRIAVVDNLADGDGTPFLYTVAGMMAKIAVHKSPASGENGAVYATAIYHGSGEGRTIVNNIYAEPINNKGIITARNFVGRAGFFIADDAMCVPASDDYGMIQRRRVIDKAYRTAYKALLPYVCNEIPVTSDGKIPPVTCAEIQNAVERAIILNMTSEGNLGTDPGNDSDYGVSCYVDPSQDVVGTSSLNVRLSVRPYGYAKYITVDLGFGVGE